MHIYIYLVKVANLAVVFNAECNKFSNKQVYRNITQENTTQTKYSCNSSFTRYASSFWTTGYNNTCPSVLLRIYIVVEEGLDGHGLLLLRVSRVMRSSELSDDRITRETLSNNNPCPSSPSSTILRSAYMALNTLQQDWLL